MNTVAEYSIVSIFSCTLWKYKSEFEKFIALQVGTSRCKFW